MDPAILERLKITSDTFRTPFPDSLFSANRSARSDSRFVYILGESGNPGMNMHKISHANAVGILMLIWKGVVVAYAVSLMCRFMS